MIKAIKTFFNDYTEAQKVCNEFYKKHWKGQILLSLAVGLTTFVALEAAEELVVQNR